MSNLIKPRERDAILQSLRAGVVPKIGLQHIQVGRKDEVLAILKDLDRIEAGGATVRFIIGRFGAGKSFFLNLTRMVALEKKFVVVHADITPDRRLHSSGGHSRSLYTELMHNMSAGSKRSGRALPGLVEQWVSNIEYDLRDTGVNLHQAIYDQLKPLQNQVSGFDFATVISKYVEGFQHSNDDMMSAALRWLHAEFETKTEAREVLGVRTIINDQDIYDYLKLMASFVKIAGYSGILVNLDEMGVLSHRLNNSQARNANYEVILRIVNDCLQGSVSGLGVIFAGTDSFMDDRRRGLASYEALATRLADNTFAVDGLKDYSGPTIRLPNLTVEDLVVLLHNIRNVFANGNPAQYLIPDEGIKIYIQYCAGRLGGDFFQTPRDAVKGFVGLLSVLEQNPATDWQVILHAIPLEQTQDPDNVPVSDDDKTVSPIGELDELVSLRLKPERV